VSRRPKEPHARTATHRPALVHRRFRYDDLTAVDLFSGFGGLTQGIEAAGFTTITAANHNAYKVKVHEANHPHVEHWIADLVDTESGDYHDVRQLPPALLLTAGVSCKNHTQANSQRAYEQGIGLWELDDPDYEAQVTRSERDRATANCVLHYAGVHHPLMILVECTTEIQSWGPAVPGKKYGDGTTYRWWLRRFENLGYRHREIFLNSMFFDVDQSRDRWYGIFVDAKIPFPDLDHRPETYCRSCDTIVAAKQTWKTGIPATGSVRYGKQYNYRCPSCHLEVVPPSGYALRSLDLSDLGTRIGDRPLKTFTDKKTGEVTRSPMAPATMARAERCRARFAQFPAVLMPVKSLRGSEKHPWQPMATQTSQQETSLLSTGTLDAAAAGLAVDNYQGAPRGVDEPLPTQAGSETMAIVSTGVLPFRRNTVPATHAEPMATFTAEQIPGLLTAAGRIQNNGAIEEAGCRVHPLDRPFGTVTASAVQQGMLFGGWYKQNGSTGTETAPHPLSDALGTITGRDTTALLAAQWHEVLAGLALEDCYFRMTKEHEIGRACGFDVTFGDHQGTFIVWGKARAQVDGYGNAVSPPVGYWITSRLRAAFHGEEMAA